MAESWRVAVGLALVAALSACTGAAQPAARFQRQHDWVGRGEWIRADTHVHSRFSDGSHTPLEILEAANRNGCQAIALTDHADRHLTAATPEYFSTVGSLRGKYPGLIVLAGIEWNIPPSGGEEHVTVLVPPVAGHEQVLAELKTRFDDRDRKDPKPRAEDALSWLATAAAGWPVRPVVVYNHPSRRDASSLENIDDVVAWRKVNDLVIGFESGPGHQGREPFGSYDSKEPLIDRWDPVAARPGDAWDRLLQRGLDVHGAMASSDFHNAIPSDLNDFWPCQFAETWYYVPEKTPVGLLRAMRAGAFFGVHGHIARNVELTVSVKGLPRPVAVGERAEVPQGSSVTAALSFVVPDLDWSGKPNKIDVIEFITVTTSGTAVHEHPVGNAGAHAVTQNLVIGPGGVVIRARGRRVTAVGPDLMFYTNAIRISAR